MLGLCRGANASEIGISISVVNQSSLTLTPVADPDLELRGAGGFLMLKQN